MPIAFIATSTKKQNGIYCCIIHKTKYNCWYLMYSDYFSQQQDKFIYEKVLFPNLYNSHFHFFEKLFYYYDCKLWNIYKNTCAFIFISIMKPEAATGGVLWKSCSFKNFAIFTGKHLWWSLFLIKLQTFRPDSKKDSNTDIFLWMLRNVEKHLFWRTSGDDCF